MFRNDKTNGNANANHIFTQKPILIMANWERTLI